MNISKDNEKLSEKVNLEKLTPEAFFIGLINEFNNRFQVFGDCLFDELSWKQEFTLSCITLFKEPPTIKELAEFLGSSHQNVKQILLKLEEGGFIMMSQDGIDKRKQRVILTERTAEFQKKYAKSRVELTRKMFEGIEPCELECTIKVIMRLHAFLKQYQEQRE